MHDASDEPARSQEGGSRNGMHVTQRMRIVTIPVGKRLEHEMLISALRSHFQTACLRQASVERALAYILTLAKCVQPINVAL